MERVTTIKEAKEIMCNNFVGPAELGLISDKMGIIAPTNYPEIPFSYKELLEKQEDYILILGLTKMRDGSTLTIKTLRNHFGITPDISEPCFYNQDWYLNEAFIKKSVNFKWYLVKKVVIASSRAQQPVDILKNNICFPSAILTAYTFFAYFFAKDEILWKYDFIWCSDFDHNGDRIYVGKYLDVDGINKNGFSIHRHLALRNCYGAIEIS